MPRPSSSTSMTTWLPFWKALSAMVPTGGLPTREALVARLDAVVDGVADHVHEGSRELLDDELVDLGLRAGDDQVHLLVVLARDLAHDARELVEDLPERDHAHLEDAVLHLREVALEGAVQALELDRRAPGARSARADAVGEVLRWRSRTMASSPTTVIRRSSLRMSTRTVWLTERSEISRPPPPTARASCAAATGTAGATAAPAGGGVRTRPCASRACGVGAETAAGRDPGGRGTWAIVGGATEIAARRRAAPAASAARERRRGARRHDRPRGPSLHLFDGDVRAGDRRAQHLEARWLAIRMSSSMVSMSPPEPVGQVRDDLAVGPRLRLELVERGVDRRQREAHPDAVERDARWMLVRRRCSSYSVSTPRRPGSRSYCATSPAPPPARWCASLPERDEQLLDLGGRVGGRALLGGEDAPVELDRLEEQVEDLRR